VVVDHITLPRRTRPRVVSGGGEIGRQWAVLGSGAARRRVAAVVVQARSAVTMEHAAAAIQVWVHEWMRAQR
jgi:hypothetical protein